MPRPVKDRGHLIRNFPAMASDRVERLPWQEVRHEEFSGLLMGHSLP